METELACASEKGPRRGTNKDVRSGLLNAWQECVGGGDIESPWLALLQPARLPPDCLSKFVSSDRVLSRSPRQQ